MNPGLRRRRILLQGELPSPIHPPSGCAFHTRCPIVMDRCRHQAPQLQPLLEDGWAGSDTGPTDEPADGVTDRPAAGSTQRVACLAVRTLGG